MMKKVEIIRAEEAVEMTLQNIGKDSVFKNIINKANEEIKQACANGLFCATVELIDPGILTDCELENMVRLFNVSGYDIKYTFGYNFVRKNNVLSINLTW